MLYSYFHICVVLIVIDFLYIINGRIVPNRYISKSTISNVPDIIFNSWPNSDKSAIIERIKTQKILSLLNSLFHRYSIKLIYENIQNPSGRAYNRKWGNLLEYKNVLALILLIWFVIPNLSYHMNIFNVDDLNKM